MIYVMVSLIILGDIVEYYIKNKEQQQNEILFDATKSYKFPVKETSFIPLFLYLKIWVFQDEFNIVVLFFLISGMGFYWVPWYIYNLYKVFNYKKIVVNNVKREILEEVIINTFNKYGYSLKVDNDFGDKEFIIEEIGTTIEFSHKDICKYILISKYKKIRNIDEIIINMKETLLEEFNIKRKFSLSKIDIIEKICIYIVNIGWICWINN